MCRISSRARALLALSLSACATTPPAPAAPPPTWWPKPDSSAELLKYAGEADASDDGEARSLARAAAMRALDTDLGVTAQSSCTDRVGQSGASELVEVECKTTVAGAPRTLRGIKLEAIQSGPSGDGRVRAYALISWPRREKAQILEADAARAKLALERLAEAEKALEARSFEAARLAIDGARTAIGGTELTFNHPTLKTAKHVLAELDALERRVAADEKSHGKVCLAGVRCKKDGLEVPCRGTRVGVLRTAVSSAGRQLAPTGIPAPTLAVLLESGEVPKEARKDAACLVAVELSSELIEAGKPFTFVRTSGRAVLYETAQGKIVWTEEIAPEKVGHVSYDDAMNKGFDAAEKTIAGRVQAALGARP